MRALYAFCFAPPALDDAPAAELAFDDCGWEDPVYIAPAAGLRAVLSECAMERFTGPEAETRLADLKWLLPRVEAHDRVINRAMGAATVFPLPFGTLFSSTAALAVEVAGRRHTLLNFFRRMDGREEWAVKALLDRERATTARLGALSDGPASGRGYLLQQRRRIEAERSLAPWLNEVIAELDAELLRHCEAVVTRPAHDPTVANRACLLAPGASAALREALEHLAAPLLAQGLELHCSGPWPLYSFSAEP